MDTPREKDYSRLTRENFSEFAMKADIRKLIGMYTTRELLFAQTLGDVVPENHPDVRMKDQLTHALEEISNVLSKDLERCKKISSDSSQKEIEAGMLAGEGVRDRITGETQAVVDAAVKMVEGKDFTYYHAIRQQMDLLREARRVQTEACVAAMDFFEFILREVNDREAAELYWEQVMSKLLIASLRQLGEYFALHLLVERAEDDYKELDDFAQFKAEKQDREVRETYWNGLRKLTQETQAIKERLEGIKSEMESGMESDIDEFMNLSDLDSVLAKLEASLGEVEEELETEKEEEGGEDAQTQ